MQAAPVTVRPQPEPWYWLQIKEGKWQGTFQLYEGNNIRGWYNPFTDQFQWLKKTEWSPPQPGIPEGFKPPVERIGPPVPGKRIADV